mgnify:CR=1 FL=1
MINKLFYIFLFFSVTTLFAQESDTLFLNQDSVLITEDSLIETDDYNPLAPAKAAFYSAVLPGLGQVYNKKYWKIPIVYTGIGISIYFYMQNNKDYNKFRDAYKRRLAGFTDDEYWGNGTTPIISSDRLVDAQKTAKRNKDANVDAHLSQFNVNDDLSFEPVFNINPIDAKANYSLLLKYRLK